MGTTKSQSHKGLYWISVFLVSGMLSSFALVVAMAEEPPSQDEETPSCEAWGRPRYIEPTKESDLSIEVQCIIGDTYLGRINSPGPNESPELLRRYLRQGPYEYGKMSGAEYRAVMEEAVRLWPQSQYAHAGLAGALLGEHITLDVQSTPADKRRAADELLLAAEIAFKQGKTPHDLDYGITIPPLLAELGDKAALDRYFERVFELLPKGLEVEDPEDPMNERYESYLQYALALDKLSDERAETYFQKAIAVSPEGVGDAYDSYARYLLQHHKAQAVLELLVPNSQVEQAMHKPSFHHLRCQALEQVGRKVEAAEACRRVHDLTPPRGGMPNPAERPGNGPS